MLPKVLCKIEWERGPKNRHCLLLNATFADDLLNPPFPQWIMKKTTCIGGLTSSISYQSSIFVLALNLPSGLRRCGLNTVRLLGSVGSNPTPVEDFRLIPTDKQLFEVMNSIQLYCIFK